MGEFTARRYYGMIRASVRSAAFKTTFKLLFCRITDKNLQKLAKNCDISALTTAWESTLTTNASAKFAQIVVLKPGRKHQ